MKKLRKEVLSLFVVLVTHVSFACGTLGACGPEPASYIIRGAKVWSPELPPGVASAIAIRQDRIVALGNREDMRPFTGPDTEVLDLDGGLIVPGFHDSHIHLLSGGLSLFEAALFQAKSLVEIQERVREFAESHPDEQWVVGRGWRYTAIPGGRLPNRAELDAVVRDRPVYLKAYDGHSAWVNTKALDLAEIGRHTRPEGYGEIVRDRQTGEPTGVLKEWGAMKLVNRLIPSPSRQTKLEALRKAAVLLNSLGTVAIQNASGDEELLELFRELLDRKELTLRVAMVFSVNPETTDADLERLRRLTQEFSGPWLRVLGAKLLVDGVIESHTAAMLKPYADQRSTRGEPVCTQAELNDLVARCHRAGLQIWIHAIGDRGVRMSLDAFEHAKSRGGPRDARFRIEHIEVIAPEDVPRLRRLGVIASMQPIHSYPDTVAVWSRAIGPDRLGYAFPWRSLVDAGTHLAFGTDWPASISVSPIRGIHAAVNRRTIEGYPTEGWIASQRVDLETALSAFSREAAYACFEDHRRGELAVGKLADIVVLSEDIFNVDAKQIHAVRPVLTMVGGKVVYRSTVAAEAARR